MLPQHLSAEIDVSTWQLPAVFKWLKRAGNVASEEMARSFNTGVGMVAVVSGSNAQQAIKELEAAGETVFTVGKLVPRTGSDKGCVLKNLSSWD
jgi:phosphoribosylamine--glycine ligase/phosphoribosylformylglycinamidine cyclo-ligase